MKGADKNKQIIIPPTLKTGDTIGIFAPAGPLPEGDLLIKGRALLEENGFKVKYADSITSRTNYLAGNDQRRLSEFQNLLNDQEVNALLAARGGYGSARLLPFINANAIRKNPKAIIGFSDITSMLNGLLAKASVVTFHGPMLSTLVRDGKSKVKKFVDILTGPLFDEIRPDNLSIIRFGTATGRLIGGNLTNMTHLLGTPFEPDWQNAILFAEDINESAYRIDRLFTHLKMAGRLDQLSGIILGDFLGNDLRPIADIDLIWQRVYELTAGHVPIWANFPVGHGPDNIILPVGLQACMRPDQTLAFTV